MTPKPEAVEVLRCGELTILGRIRSASNATFLCEAVRDGDADGAVHCVYKPVAGEQPLWDFPDGTLAGRELATFLVSDALGWNIVPHTIIRDGPAGPGMCQLWVDQPEDLDEEEVKTLDLVDLCPAEHLPEGYLPVLRAQDYAGADVLLIHADDERLRRMAVFDVLVNNADRKGGHILHGIDDNVYGVDHGLCLHIDDKLRTVLWGWAGKPIEDDTLEAVKRLIDALDGHLADTLVGHITDAEVIALEDRARAMVEFARMPTPDRHRPIPWPAF
ncbi:SCO1664 family protein [soil metagenome]